MMRPKSVNPDMPPRLQPVTRALKSGKVWTSYYYNGRSADGKCKMTSGMLRLRFVAARTKAAEQAEHRGDMELAGKIRRFQFRDARPNAASEMKLEDAQRLLGHSKEQMTKAVYRRIGERMRPTK